MSQQDITHAEALTRLAASTAEAIAQVLDMLAPGAVERGSVSVVPEGTSPFGDLPAGAVAASVSYVDGVTGGNIFVLAPDGAHALARAMGAPPADTEPAEDGAPVQLSELELSAVSEASNQMMAAAAGAIGVVLGHEIEISPPDTRVLDDPKQAVSAWGTAPYATSTTFLVGGHPSRLIQLVPSAFVVRMVRAMDELSAEQTSSELEAGATPGRAAAGGEAGVGLREALGDVKLRVWAELGRTRLPLGRTLALPLGAVVDLDCPAEAPVDIFVNGLLFGKGQLFVADDGEWAVQLQAVGTQTQRKGALV